MSVSGQPEAVIVDVGTGNLASVANALLAQGFRAQVSSDQHVIGRAGRLILPGVGAFARFMDGLRQRCLLDILVEKARQDVPFLGICVGMQALMEESEEMGAHPGLGLIRGRVVRFPRKAGLKVPQTGWNQVRFEPCCPLFIGLRQDFHVYFNHSFFVQPEYDQPYASAVQLGRVYGVQFHPEKSQQAGLTILRNFMLHG